ncbi:MAG: nucleotide exchange factor GrpE [Candidatus Omnitrophota bacterium]
MKSNQEKKDHKNHSAPETADTQKAASESDTRQGQTGSPETAAGTLEEAKRSAQENWEKMLRLKADFENTKKRLERDKVEAAKFANERLLADILPVVDNLDRAMTSLADGHDPDKVQQGLKIANDQLHAVLERYGVEVIKTQKQRFDPQFHEAVAIVDTAADDQDGVIVDEIQRGYLLNGRLIRPSRVRVGQKAVSKGQPAEENEQGAEEAAK